MSEAKPLIYLSLGGGVQSSALLAMSERGDIPRADVAIFADTQDEPSWVYRHLDWLRKMSTIPIITVTKGRLSDSAILRIPAFVLNKDGEPGPLTQNCTRDYKRSVVRRAARGFMEHTRRAVCMLGISQDEAHRQKDSGVKWLKHDHPLVDGAITRSGCVAYLERAGWPVPRKSACVYCPWHSDRSWREVRDNDPAGWRKAVAFDARIAEKRGARLHKSMQPLDRVDLTDNQIDLFGNECEGMCGV